MQAPRFERLPSDPFPLLQNGFVAAEVNIAGCDVVEALVAALMVIAIDQGFDLGLEVTPPAFWNCHSNSLRDAYRKCQN